MRSKGLFDREHDKSLANAEYAWFEALYANQIKTVDSIVNTLESALADSDLTKAELARRLDVESANVRRFFLGVKNPTIHTVADLAYALGFDLVLIPRTSKSSHRRKISGKQASAESGLKSRSVQKERVSV